MGLMKQLVREPAAPREGEECTGDEDGCWNRDGSMLEEVWQRIGFHVRDCDMWFQLERSIPVLCCCCSENIVCRKLAVKKEEEEDGPCKSMDRVVAESIQSGAADG